MSYKVLYIEDELHLAGIVKETMELKGYTVMHQEHGLKLLDAIRDFEPDICVLDVMLPYMDGFSIGAKIREVYKDMPVIFLTAKGQTADVLEGFASGGNDYLKKPFSMEELMARMNNLIRLKQGSREKPAPDKPAPQCFYFGSFVYNPQKLELLHKGTVIKLSNREAEILNIFALHVNASVDRREMMQSVWGDDSYFISRNLDVYIRRLRDYFAAGAGVEIITLKGKGYHFSVEVIKET